MENYRKYLNIIDFEKKWVIVKSIQNKKIIAYWYTAYSEGPS